MVRVAPAWTSTGLLWILVLAAATFGAHASHQGPDDVNSLDLHVLVYHPTPDDQNDPWGVPAFSRNGTAVDWMAGFYDGFLFPTAVFDGIHRFESTPVGEGGGPHNETYRAYRTAFEAERSKGSPITIRLGGHMEGPQFVANATLIRSGLLEGEELSVRAVFFEDDVPYDGGNGITNHRFVVRALTGFEPVDFGPSGEQPLEYRFIVPSGAEAEHFGLAVIVQNLADESRLFEPKEVVQAASWRVGLPFVRQAAKGVLLELYSATWCAACIYADTASDQLANEFGIASSLVVEHDFEYLRPGPWWQVAAASVAGGALIGVAFASRRRRPPGQEAKADVPA